MFRKTCLIVLGFSVLVFTFSVVSCKSPTPTRTPTVIPTPTATTTPIPPKPTPTSTPPVVPSPTPTSAPTPVIVSVDPKQVRDLAITFTALAMYPGIMRAEWVETQTLPQPVLSRGQVAYAWNGWTVTVSYPIVAKPDCQVNIKHKELEVDWTGTVKSDGTVEGPDLIKFVGLAPIMIISFTPSAVDGKIVILVGEYRGWRPEGGSPPPVTKSDWVLNDKTGELYVTGAIPALDPAKDVGQLVTVIGIVKLADGIPYLRATEVQKGTYQPGQ